MTTGAVVPARAELGRVSLRDASLAQDIVVLRASVASSVLGHLGAVTVELSGLSRPSSLAVGAVLSARRHCRVRGIPFSIQGATGSIRQAMLSCGLVENRGLLLERP